MTTSLTTRIFLFLWLGLAPLAPALAEGGGRHLRGHGFLGVWTFPRVWVAAMLVALGSVFFLRNRLTRRLRLVLMGVTFVVFGVLASLSLGSLATGLKLQPSPVCMIAKPFLFLATGRGIPLFFLSLLAFAALATILSNKGFCAWACPVGALQELLYRLPVLRDRKRQLSFRLSNGVRLLLFGAFLAVVLWSGFNLYEYLNAFHLLHWDELGPDPELLIPFVLVFLAAFFLYRPFCYLVCPLGLATWCLEPLSVTRVQVDRDACTECGVCVQESPCPSVQSILDGDRMRPDCHQCGECVSSCPEGALRFGK